MNSFPQVLGKERNNIALLSSPVLILTLFFSYQTAESDLSKMRETLQNLQETLEAKTAVEQELRQQLEATEKQLETTNRELLRSAGAADSLREEVGQLRGEYERGMLSSSEVGRIYFYREQALALEGSFFLC